MGVQGCRVKFRPEPVPPLGNTCRRVPHIKKIFFRSDVHDNLQGTVNLVAASKGAGLKRFVYVTSIGTDDPIYNPLNLFWGVLFWKKRAEEELQRSRIPYTIIRPGGLVNDDADTNSASSDKDSKVSVPRRGTPSTRGQGNVVMASAGTYGIPPKKSAGSIKRSKVRCMLCAGT